MLDAIKDISADPTALAALSVPGKAAFDALKEVLEKAAAAPLAAIESLATPVLTDIMMRVSDLVGAIPVVGTFVGVAIKIIDVLINASSLNRAADDRIATFYISKFQPVGSGSILGEGRIVPADLFVHNHTMLLAADDPDWRARYVEMAPKQRRELRIDGKFNPMTNGFVVGCQSYPSVIGQALMTLTEGSPVGEGAIHFKYLDAIMRKYPDYLANPAYEALMGGKPYVRDKSHWRELVARNYAMACHLAGVQGVPSARRRQFAKLRHAIQRSWRKSGDGGAALWIIYLDLLKAEIDQGHLTPDAMIKMLGLIPRAYLGGPPPFWMPVWGFETERGAYATTRIADQVVALAAQWGDAVNPAYVEGRAKIAQIDAAVTRETRPRASAPTAMPAPPTRPDASAPTTAPPAGDRAADDEGAGRALVVGAGVLGGLWLLKRLLRRPPPPAIG